MISARNIRDLAALAVDHLGPVTVLQLSCQLRIGMDDAATLVRCPEFARYPLPWGPPVYTLSKKVRRSQRGR